MLAFVTSKLIHRMTRRMVIAASVAGVLAGLSLATAAEKAVAPVLNFKVKSITGQDVDLSQYQGKVVLIVNVASKCGLTPQYDALQDLHEKYKDQGLVVLGFPCNQFGGQEPGSEAEISQFCKSKYDITFDMFAKVDVNGDAAAPLYKHLTSKETDPSFAGPIGWNFEKFLIGRNGEIVNRFKPRTAPSAPEVVKAIETELAKK